jgi:hypothetical protein
MVAEDGGAPVAGPATLPIMSKCRKALFPSVLGAQGGVFVLRTKRCEQLQLFAGEAGLANGQSKSAEMLFVAVYLTRTRRMTGGNHRRL